MVGCATLEQVSGYDVFLDQSACIYQPVGAPDSKTQISLEPNHSMYVLIASEDKSVAESGLSLISRFRSGNRIVKKGGTLIGRRGDLMKDLAEHCSDTLNQAVPRLCFVLGGGQSTLKTVAKELSHDVFVILIRGCDPWEI